MPRVINILKRLLLFWSISLCLVPSSLYAQTNRHTPNIVFIVADYMGYSDIEPYGSQDIKTPSLNALASRGLRFSNHYSAASSCIPSRASLMSGKYPSKVLERFKQGRGRGLHKKNNHLLSGLKGRGYKTALIGKWHLGDEENFSPNDHGFDYFLGFNAWTLGYHNHLTSDGEPGLFRNKKLVTEKGYLTDLFTQEAGQFINENTDNPFFLYLSYNAGLPPYQAPDIPESEWNSRWNPNEATRADYIAMIERMDQGIGKVLKTLKEHKLEEKTLIIFTYDHGGRHLVDSGPLFHGFGTLWEGGIRVPLIIQWPNKVKKSGVVEMPTIAMDVTATMLAAAEADSVFDSLDGTNLFDVMKKPDEFTRRDLYWNQGRMKAVLNDSWKYVVDGHSQLLFNLRADVGERTNVFFKYPNKVNELRRKLADWEKSLDE